jgi:subtilase family serine protease
MLNAPPLGGESPGDDADRQQLADLAISSFDFEPAAPTQLQPGSSMRLYVWVENRGHTDAGPFWLEFWASRLGGVRIWPQLIEQSDRIQGLAAGQSILRVLDKPLTGVPDGSYTVVAVVDRLEEVPESNEANNRFIRSQERVLVVRPATGTNLTLEYFTISPDPLTAGQTAQINATVRNTGTGASGVFWIEFWASRDQCYPQLDYMLCDSVRVDNLAAGQAHTLANHTATVSSAIPAGSYAVGCFIDRIDQVNETDESDNYRFLSNRTVGP